MIVKLVNDTKYIMVWCIWNFFWTFNIAGAAVSEHIKLDHFGYRVSDSKIVIFTADPGTVVYIRDGLDTVVYTIPSDGGSITSKGNDGQPSGDDVWWVDLSSFVQQGTYHLFSPALPGKSYEFEVRDDVYNQVVLTALKTFYYQRCNTAKEVAYAGNWADANACHMTDVAVTAAPGTPDYGTLDLSGGWHDAGDYNKYVWSAVSNAVLYLLRAYEDNPGIFKDGDLAIPESGNNVPDILDEVKWELDWLLKMQLPSGAVVHDLHVLGYASNSPPSADSNSRYYDYNDLPNVESGSVFAGCCALGSRVFGQAGLTTYAATLKSAALTTWSWLQTQGDSEDKVWAAAELFRLDETLDSARNYVDNFYPDSWTGRFFNVGSYDTQAAIVYVQASGATAGVVTNMQTNINEQVNYIFNSNDLYRNGMPSWSYHWGSNAMRAFYGIFLLKAAQLGLTGSHSSNECVRQAQNFLHFFHGQNTMNMVYLTNMAAVGGEHSSFQFYHAWFGDSQNTFSGNWFIGKPAAVVEPAYPYFSGSDNLGISDDNYSTLGPAPGFVPGGPNSAYSGTAIPPLNATYYNKYYRDWCENDDLAQVKSWEITENSISYQGPYVCLGSYFMVPAPAVPTLSRFSFVILLLCLTIVITKKR
ncbi:glycoside hydrolase family 9 protein [candidate division CSSED10-310 bacterium]|uniref:Glycoside hydrolase family 9 protein n=1 Tax=candidate division CSSED10-310 bacterium TaxID=2855610 RepID=A0ABV6Z6W6_UNCC1